jgi:hypothetical protein
MRDDMPARDDRAVNLDNALLLISKLQAQALADLLWEGKQNGEPDCDPPKRVALVAAGAPEEIDHTLDQTRDGEHLVGDDGRTILTTSYPPHHTLGVVADDGRVWQITRAGICWLTANSAPWRPA